MSITADTFIGPELAPDRLERWLERWGGWLVAGLIHLSLLALFSNQLVVIKTLITPKRSISIRFQLPQPPPPAPPPTQPLAVPLMVPENVATTTDPDPKEADDTAQVLPGAAEENPDPGESDAATPPNLETASTAPALLPPEVKAQLREELERLRRQMAAQDIEQNRIRTAVHKLEVEAKGRNYTFDSDGGRQGAIRTLDVSGFPDEVVHQVFRKYHIYVERKVGPSEERPSFLNAAVTDGKTYRSSPVSGLRDVFVLSGSAIAMMSRLETEALVERGFNPGNTRVLEIRFGIVKNAQDEWDLGVTKLETEQLR